MIACEFRIYTLLLRLSLFVLLLFSLLLLILWLLQILWVISLVSTRIYYSTYYVILIWNQIIISLTPCNPYVLWSLIWQFHFTTYMDEQYFLQLVSYQTLLFTSIYYINLYKLTFYIIHFTINSSMLFYKQSWIQML